MWLTFQYLQEQMRYISLQTLKSDSVGKAKTSPKRVFTWMVKLKDLTFL